MDFDLDEIESPTLNINAGGLTGTRVALVKLADWPAFVSALRGFVVMIGPVAVRVGAQSWPGIPFLVCTEVKIVGYGRWEPSNFEDGVIPEKVRVEINYTTLPYSQDEDDNGPEDETYLTQTVEYGCEILTVPMKVSESITQTTFPYNTITSVREVKRHIRVPTVTYKLTRDFIMIPNWTLFNSTIGDLNSTTFCRGGAGTVLFDGISAAQEVKTVTGGRAWKLTFDFLYQRHGWNSMLHPDTLQWVDAKSLQGGNDPYPTSSDFKKLIEAT